VGSDVSRASGDQRDDCDDGQRARATAVTHHPSTSGTQTIMVSWCAPGQTERKRRAVLVAPRYIVDRLARVRPGLVSDLRPGHRGTPQRAEDVRGPLPDRRIAAAMSRGSWTKPKSRVAGRASELEPVKISAHAPLRARTEGLISTTTLGRAHSRRSGTPDTVGRPRPDRSLRIIANRSPPSIPRLER